MISKITPAGAHSLEEALNPKASKTDKARFQQELSRAIGGKESASSSTATSEGLSEISAPECSTECSNRQLEGKTDELLSMLEQYSQQLTSPATSLRDIASVVEGIRENAESLLNSAELSINGDPELIDIARESVITARNEVIKFQRGDYL